MRRNGRRQLLPQQVARKQLNRLMHRSPGEKVRFVWCLFGMGVHIPTKEHILILHFLHNFKHTSAKSKCRRHVLSARSGNNPGDPQDHHHVTLFQSANCAFTSSHQTIQLYSSEGVEEVCPTQGQEQFCSNFPDKTKSPVVDKAKVKHSKVRFWMCSGRLPPQVGFFGPPQRCTWSTRSDPNFPSLRHWKLKEITFQLFCLTADLFSFVQFRDRYFFFFLQNWHVSFPTSIVSSLELLAIHQRMENPNHHPPTGPRTWIKEIQVEPFQFGKIDFMLIF